MEESEMEVSAESNSECVEMHSESERRKRLRDWSVDELGGDSAAPRVISPFVRQTRERMGEFLPFAYVMTNLLKIAVTLFFSSRMFLNWDAVSRCHCSSIRLQLGLPSAALLSAVLRVCGKGSPTEVSSAALLLFCFHVIPKHEFNSVGNEATPRFGQLSFNL